MDFWKFILWGIILFVVGNLALWLIRFVLQKSGTTFRVETELAKLFPVPTRQPT